MNEQQPLPTTKVGRYQLVQKLAVGGMAEVFLAVERAELNRLVVVKRMLPHLAEHQGFIEMFLQEARIAARINHPNVVQIYELGHSTGLPFIAMEYVRGSTLKELLIASVDAEVRLPVDVVLCIAIQALAGIHAAHQLTDDNGKPSGLVHRDLSPHNLMLTNEGHLKLLDFGIAKATELATEETRTGMLKGKISYMAPEQALQEPLDRRCDLFALGTVLWELLAGKRLWHKNTELATMQGIVQGKMMPLVDERPDVPPSVAAVIEKALRLNREERWPTAADMRAALLDAARESGVKPDQDRTALLVQTLLGQTQRDRQAAVEEALERTLVTLSLHAEPSDEPTVATSSVAVKAGMLGAVATVVLIGALGVATLALVGGVWMALTDPQHPVAQDVAYGGEPVKVAIAAPTSADIIRSEYEPLRLYLETALQRDVELLVDESYQKTADSLVSGEVSFASLPPNTYVQTKAALPGMQILAIKQFDGSNGTDGYLMVSESSSATSVEELKGSVICYPNELSTTGYVLPRDYIKRHGMDPDTDFTPHFSGNHHQVMRDVHDGVCGLGGTYSGAYITADEAGVPIATLRVLAVTGRTPHDAFCAGPNADPTVVAAMKDALLGFDPKKVVGSERLGKSDRITAFVPAKDTDFDTLRTALTSMGMFAPN